MFPDEGVSGPYYLPLVIAGAAYVVLLLAAQVLRRRDNSEGAAKLEDLAFGLSLVAAAYVIVLVIVALTSEFDLVWDMVRIIAIVIAFFALLVVLCLLLFEMGVGRLARRRR